MILKGFKVLLFDLAPFSYLIGCIR